MIRRYKVMTDIVFLTCARSFYKIVSITTVFFISRCLGPYKVGIYFFVFAFARVWAYFINSGLNNYLIRTVASRQGNEGDLLQDILSFRINNFFISIFIGIVICFLFFRDIWLYCLIGIISLSLDEISFSFSSFFLAKRKVLFNIITGISSKIVFVGFLTWALIFKKSLVSILSAYLFSSAYLIFIGWLFMRFFLIPVKPRFHFDKYLSLYKSGVFFILVSLLYGASSDIPSLIMMHFNKIKDVGMLNSAYLLCKGALLIPESVAAVLFPVSVYFIAKDAIIARTMYFKYIWLLIFLGSLTAVLLVVFRSEIINLLYGKGFDDAISILKIVALSLPFMFANILNITYLYSLSKEKFLAGLFLISLLLYSAISIIVIKLYGVQGVAILIPSYNFMLFLISYGAIARQAEFQKR